MSAQSQAMSNDYQRNVSTRNELLNELNARRRDRIDNIRKSGVTLLGIIEQLRDRETRRIQGEHLELVRMAKEKQKTEWRKVNAFPDGTKDYILLDDMIKEIKDDERTEDVGSTGHDVQGGESEGDKPSDRIEPELDKRISHKGGVSIPKERD